MDKIEVSQRAREAYLAMEKTYKKYHAAVLGGQWDNDPTIQELARFERDILATRTDATPVAWMPIDSAPMDEQILAAIKVNHKNGKSWWERHIIVIDSETGTISDMDFHHGWEAEDYECWQPLPAAPDATNTRPPATDVAALVERDQKFCRIVWDALKGDHTDLKRQQIILEAFRSALAPFTKGQP